MADTESWTEATVYYEDKIGSRETAAEFLRAFGERFPNYHIDKMGHWEPLTQPYTLASATDLWTTSSAHSDDVSYGHLILHGESPLPFYVFVNWYGHGSAQIYSDNISMHALRRKGTEILSPERAVDMFKFLLSWDAPYYGTVTTSEELEAKGWRSVTLEDGRRSKESIALSPKEGLIDLFWANYFGEPFLQAFGKKRAELSSSENCQAVANGVIVHLTRAHALAWQSDVRFCEKLREVIGKDFFFDKTKGLKPRKGPIF